MAENAVIWMQPNGALIAKLDGRVVATGWMVVDIEQLSESEPAVVRLLFAGKRVAS